MHKPIFKYRFVLSHANVGEHLPISKFIYNIKLKCDLTVFKMEDLRTEHVIEKEARELRIYNEFQTLLEVPGAMKSRVARIISEKYKLRSNTTLHNIRKRVEKRLASQSLVSA